MSPVSKRRSGGNSPRQVAARAGALTGPISRPCPRCGAQIGYRCRQLSGEWAGWPKATKFHKERQAHKEAS